MTGRGDSLRYCARVRARSLSSLMQMSDDAFARGVARLEAHCLNFERGRIFREPVDVFVFQRRSALTLEARRVDSLPCSTRAPMSSAPRSASSRLSRARPSCAFYTAGRSGNLLQLLLALEVSVFRVRSAP